MCVWGVGWGYCCHDNISTWVLLSTDSPIYPADLSLMITIFATSCLCWEVHCGFQLRWLFYIALLPQTRQCLRSWESGVHSIKQGSSIPRVAAGPTLLCQCTIPTAKGPLGSLHQILWLQWPVSSFILDLDWTSHGLACNWCPTVSAYYFSSVVSNTGWELAGELLKETENILNTKKLFGTQAKPVTNWIVSLPWTPSHPIIFIHWSPNFCASECDCIWT